VLANATSQLQRIRAFCDVSTDSDRSNDSLPCHRIRRFNRILRVLAVPSAQSQCVGIRTIQISACKLRLTKILRIDALSELPQGAPHALQGFAEVRQFRDQQAHEASATSETPTAWSQCFNCSAPLDGRFCANCGQAASSDMPNAMQFVHQSIESITHADSRLWRTLRLLWFRPAS